MIFQQISNFFSNPIFNIFGGIAFIIGLLLFIYKIFCWSFNITPVIVKLGFALWRRKIAIISSAESFADLSSSLIDSKIFKKNKIVHIGLNNIEKAKDFTLYIVDWETVCKKIEEIYIARKNHQTPIVIYAKPKSIQEEVMKDIANRPNTIVVNFRGRLLSDILVSMMTTNYDGK